MAIEIAEKNGKTVMFKTGRCRCTHTHTECLACGFYGGCPAYTMTDLSVVKPSIFKKVISFIGGGNG